MPRLRVSDAAHASLQARARAERRTLTAVLDGLLDVSTPAPRQAKPRAETCSSCGHRQAQHRPSCVSMGCACRTYRAA